MATSRSSSSLLAGTKEESGLPTSRIFSLGENCVTGNEGTVKPRLEVHAWPDAVKLLGPLIHWFDSSRRVLPWRAKDLAPPHPDPYAVLVSELMLQQTQVATVIPYFERWLRSFPNPATLAEAGEESIHKHWEGLGYYRRARHLQQAARTISMQGWPKDLQGLLQLPGLGPYTAAAVASIAFQLPAPALDGNALRVAARLLALEDPVSVQADLRDWLRPALARLGPSRTTQGIMELGALVCLPKSPHCGECPLAQACAAKTRGCIERCPAARKRPTPREVELWLVALSSGGSWLLERPAEKGLLAGLWRWPALALPPVSATAAEAAAPFGIQEAAVLPGWVQSYSHRREHVRPCRITTELPPAAGPGRAWIREDALDGLPMGSRDQRLRNILRGPINALAAAPPTTAILAAIATPTDPSAQGF